MSKLLPKNPRHLHIFGVSLVVIVAAVAVFLFAVKMEATAPAAGVVSSHRLVRLYAPKSMPVHYLSAEGKDATNDQRLLPGTVLPAETPVIGDGTATFAPVRTPASAQRWQVLELPFDEGQWARQGDVLAIVVPVEPDTGKPLELFIRAQVDEKFVGPIAAGQNVRLYSDVYPHRTHGIANGSVECIEPLGVEGPNGNRRFHVHIRVVESPFPLLLGSSVRAEILTGSKPTYQIILEH